MTEGVLLVDKPAGPTSHDVVAAAKRGLGAAKAGHAGALDPLATGLLILATGRWTRLLEHLVGLDKEYEATARLGQATDTLDPEGRVVAEDDAWTRLEAADVEAAVLSLVGALWLPPPAYSAVKVRGTPAHRRARRGEQVRLAPRACRVHAVRCLAAAPPEVRFRVSCSSGTYVRSLAAELGARLGTACHLAALRRTRAGRFDVADAAPLASLRDGTPPPSSVVAPEDALAHLPQVTIGPDQAAALAHGRPVRQPEAERPPGAGLVAAGAGIVAPGAVAVLSEAGELLAVCAAQDGALRPKKVFRRG